MANDFNEIHADRLLVIHHGGMKVRAVFEMRDRHPEMSLSERVRYVEYLMDNHDTPLNLLDGHTAFMKRREESNG